MDIGTQLPTPAPGVVAVASLSQAARHKRDWDAVLTLEDPRARLSDQLRFHRKPHPEHLVIRCEDVDEDDIGIWTATRDDVAAIIEFGRRAAGRSLLIHCFHGRGRSGAATLAILTDRMGDPSKALRHLLSIRPEACPNRVIAAHADDLLGCRGALMAVLDSWEASRLDIQQCRLQRRFLIRTHRHLYADSPSKGQTVSITKC